VQTRRTRRRDARGVYLPGEPAALEETEGYIMSQPEQPDAITAVRRSPREIVRDGMDLWARASVAEARATDCADLDLREQTVAHYREALACYDELGSSRDSARVRMILRDLGVRVRHWTYEPRPHSGWSSLTSTERQIAELVALGMTNRQVGAEMFISAHTVAFHLRQVFRKLDITSRVALARMAAEREWAPRTA
jgi:DNA-binding CsgD family transcriptional regulator